MADTPKPQALFRQRNFAALWAGQLISILGDRFTYLALGGLLLDHTRRGVDPRYPELLAYLGNVMLAPVLLFAPFTGAWVDRLNLRRVMIVSDLLRAGVVFLIPTFYAVTHHTGLTFALVFALFTCNVFFLPARSAITPEIVPAGQLLTANALLAVAGIVSTAVGALAGGWIVDHWGWTVAMQVDAATYLVSVGTLALIRYRPVTGRSVRPPVTMRLYIAEVAEGWTQIRRNAHVGLAMLALGAVWVGGGFLHVAGNPHIQHAASLPGMERVGVLLFVLGLGSALGTWYINTRGRRWSRAALLGGGLVATAAGLVIFAVTTRFAVFAIAAFLIGIAAAPPFTLSETVLQERTDPQHRGRIFSVRDFLMRLAFLLSMGIAAPAARVIGTRGTLLLCAGLVFVAGLLALVWGRRDPELGRPSGSESAPTAPRA